MPAAAHAVVMPMIDAFIPEAALTADAEARLFEQLTELLVRLEGFAPDNERARAATWIFLQRPKVFRAGAAPAEPRYRFILTVPEGQYNDDNAAAVVKEVTEAVARAEGRALEEVAPRVWVFPLEIPDGRWGGQGRVRRLPDILAALVGESERQVGVDRLAAGRHRAALAILASAQSPSR
jgi:phenylpyruvate tautomerase PptA (4-oxalocrotonate tautomerase family)